MNSSVITSPLFAPCRISSAVMCDAAEMIAASNVATASFMSIPFAFGCVGASIVSRKRMGTISPQAQHTGGMCVGGLLPVGKRNVGFACRPGLGVSIQHGVLPLRAAARCASNRPMRSRAAMACSWACAWSGPARPIAGAACAWREASSIHCRHCCVISGVCDMSMVSSMRWHATSARSRVTSAAMGCSRAVIRLAAICSSDSDSVWGVGVSIDRSLVHTVTVDHEKNGGRF